MIDIRGEIWEIWKTREIEAGDVSKGDTMSSGLISSLVIGLKLGLLSHEDRV